MVDELLLTRINSLCYIIINDRHFFQNGISTVEVQKSRMVYGIFNLDVSAHKQHWTMNILLMITNGVYYDNKKGNPNTFDHSAALHFCTTHKQ